MAWPVTRWTVSNGSPAAKSLMSGSTELDTNVPFQWSFVLPAALTQVIPCARALATSYSGVPGPPVPSPRLVLNQPIEWLTTLTPRLIASSTDWARPTSESMHRRKSWAPGAIWCTISATAVPCSVPVGGGASRLPLQWSMTVTDAGSPAPSSAW